MRSTALVWTLGLLLPSLIWPAGPETRPRVRDLGVLTSTLSVGLAVDAVGWTLEQPGNQEVRSVRDLLKEAGRIKP